MEREWRTIRIRESPISTLIIILIWEMIRGISSSIKMKDFIFAVVFLFSFQSILFGIEENEIIPKFYQILLSKEMPSVEDEKLFFGGSECSALRDAILEKVRYSQSKIPVWEFARDHKDVFITKNIVDGSQFHALFSEPFISVRSWDGNVNKDKRVHVSFPEELLDPKKLSFSGFASITFSLGKSCYINIAATTVCRSSTKAISDLVFGLDAK